MERLLGMSSQVLEEIFLPFVLADSELSRHAPEVSFNFSCLSFESPPSFQPYRREMVALMPSERWHPPFPVYLSGKKTAVLARQAWFVLIQIAKVRWGFRDH